MQHRFRFLLLSAIAAILFVVNPARAQTPPDSPGQAQPQSPTGTQQPPAAVIVPCTSKIGERQECPADTSRGVVLARSHGEAPCLLGKTWGYTDKGVWVADGCAADFLVARGTTAVPETTKGAPRYVPNAGFLIVEHDLGEMYIDPRHGEAEADRELDFLSYQQLVVHPHVGHLLIAQLTNYPGALSRAIAEHHERPGNAPRQ